MPLPRGFGISGSGRLTAGGLRWLRLRFGRLGLALAVGFGFGSCLGGLGGGRASLAARIGRIEPAALENDAHRVNDPPHRTAALRAFGDRVLRNGVANLKAVVVGQTLVLVKRHFLLYVQ